MRSGTEIFLQTAGEEMQKHTEHTNHLCLNVLVLVRAHHPRELQYRGQNFAEHMRCMNCREALGKAAASGSSEAATRDA